MNSDDVAVYAYVGLGGLAVVAIASLVFSFFIALKSTPGRRAAWTAGLAYLAATLILAMMTSEETGIYAFAPLVIALPGAMLAYWYWFATFRRAWVDDAGDLPAHVEAEDDDWRAGLMRLALILVAVIAIGGTRLLLRSL